MPKILNHPILLVFKREISKIVKNKLMIFLLVLGPLSGYFLVINIFSKNTPRDLPVTVVDHDQSFLSRKLIRFVDATPIAKVKSICINLEEARLELNKGNIEAILYIPGETEKLIQKGEDAQIELYLNNANVLKAGLLNSGIKKAIATLSSGIKLKRLQMKGMNFKQAFNTIQPVNIHSIMLFNPYLSYSYFLTLALVPIILIIFILLGTIYTIGNELYKGSGIEWLGIADNNMFYALTGKLLPYFSIYLILTLIMNVLLINIIGVPFKGSIFILLLSEIMLIVSYQFMAIFFLGITSNLRLSLSLGSAYCMLAITYSGLTFPEFSMPAFGKSLAFLFPFNHWFKVFIGQTLRGEPGYIGFHHLIILLVFILLGLLLIPKLKHILLNKKYWGKY